MINMWYNYKTNLLENGPDYKHTGSTCIISHCTDILYYDSIMADFITLTVAQVSNLANGPLVLVEQKL